MEDDDSKLVLKRGGSEGVREESSREFLQNLFCFKNQVKCGMILQK